MINTYHVTWEGVEKSVEALCLQITNTLENPIDLVVGIARGGVIPARLVAEQLDIHDIEVIKKNDSINDIFGKLNGYINILFIDDINDTGKTFNALTQVMNHMAIRGQYQMGALYKRYNTTFKSARFGIEIKDDNYLIFPWEHYNNEI